MLNTEQGEGLTNNEQGMTIGEGKVVRGERGEIYCSNYPIHLFSNKRITCFSGHPGHNRFFIRSRSKFYHQKNSHRLLIQNDRACIVLIGGFLGCEAIHHSDLPAMMKTDGGACRPLNHARSRHSDEANSESGGRICANMEYRTRRGNIE